MDRRHFLSGCGCCGLAAALGPAYGADLWQSPERFSRPDIQTDEGGLWSLLDREEGKLKRSRFLIREGGLQEYVNGIVCRLAGAHCPDVRVYVVRTPYFNASMAPNGMMQVWSGLLLRMANEAQLAAVLGHEIGHYLARHSIERLRDAKSRSAFGQFLGMALGAAGAGGAGAVAQLVLAAGAMAYGRDHEREADRIGMDLMAKAGYEPMEASRVWQQLLAELEAEKDWSGDAGQNSVLFASHPPAAERQATLGERARELAPQFSGLQDGELAYRKATATFRKSWLEDELRRRRSGESLALLQRLLAQRPGDGELQFFLGEVYRLRAGDGDRERALAAYREAEPLPGAPPEVYRAMGMLYRQDGDARAGEYFRRYLAAKPGAEDGELIATYLKGEG